MSQADANPLDPSAPLEPLPGHSSHGRLRTHPAPRRVRRHRRAQIRLTAPIRTDVYERAAIFDGWVDGINAVDASGANAPHVVGRHLRAADPHGLCAHPADLLPRQEPHRHPGRRARRFGHGCAEHSLPDRRRRAGRRPARRQAGVRSRLHVALWKPSGSCATIRKFLSGRKLTSPPTVFLGAAINPFAPPHDFRPHRLAKKIAAGAQFVQSQYCYERAHVQKDTCSRCATWASTRNASSCAASVRWLRRAPPNGCAPTSPGVHIPDEIIKRLEGAEDQKKEGKQLCIDTHQRGQGDRGCLRHSRHGLPPGGVRRRDCPRIGRAQGPQALAQGAQSGGRTGRRAHGGNP